MSRQVSWVGILRARLQTAPAYGKLAEPMAKRQNELQRFAAIGALARIQELQREIDRIRTAFPSLRADGRVQASATPSPKRRRKMSAAAKKAIGLAQRKRWAEWRKKKGASAKG